MGFGRVLAALSASPWFYRRELVVNSLFSPIGKTIPTRCLAKSTRMSPAFASSVGIAAYLALFAVVGLLFLFVNLLVGRFVRASNPSPEKQETYECGEPTIGSSYIQYDLRFYVVALLFIIFDVEVAFFFPWATVFGKTTNMADERLPVVECSVGDDSWHNGLAEEAKLLYRELGVRNAAVSSPAILTGRVDGSRGHEIKLSSKQLEKAEVTGNVRLSSKQLGEAEEATVSIKLNSKQLEEAKATGIVELGSKQLEEAGKATAIIKKSSKQLAWVTIIDICVFFAVQLVGFAYVWKRGDLDWVRAVGRQRAEGAAESPSTPNLGGQAVPT